MVNDPEDQRVRKEMRRRVASMRIPSLEQRVRELEEFVARWLSTTEPRGEVVSFCVARGDIMEDARMSDRNWEALLLATLERARRHFPSGPFEKEDLEKMSTTERRQAALGADIDNILSIADERAA
jgi:hypothetical protein